MKEQKLVSVKAASLKETIEAGLSSGWLVAHFFVDPTDRDGFLILEKEKEDVPVTKENFEQTLTNLSKEERSRGKRRQ